MDIIIAVSVLTVAAALFGFANYKARQPYEPGPGFRVPYTALQFVLVLVAVVAVGFLLTQS